MNIINSYMIKNGSSLITGMQIRIARQGLGWSRTKLAKRANLGAATIARMERQSGVPSSSALKVNSVKIVLEEYGIEFRNEKDVSGVFIPSGKTQS